MLHLVPRRPASSWREECLTLLAAGDWYPLSRTAMAWRLDGGAYTPEAWLADVSAALLNRQPKTAVHCCDMALHVWVERPQDRAVLHHVRGLLVADHLRDPASAVADLELAADGPAWLRDDTRRELERVRGRAATSRVRVPRAQPAPEYDAAYLDLVSGPSSSPRPPRPDPFPEDGAEPALWARTLPLLTQA